MFLHDQLIALCKGADITEPTDVQELFSEIQDICYKEIIKNIKDTSTKQEVKTAFDRVFNFYNLFIKQALDSEDTQLLIIAGIIQNYNYKDVLFKNNPHIKEIYNKL